MWDGKYAFEKSKMIQGDSLDKMKYIPNGKMQFYDSDPFFGGVHALFVDKKSVEEIIDSY